MIVGTYTHCCQPLYQLVMKLAMLSTYVPVVAELGTVVNRYVSRWQTWHRRQQIHQLLLWQYVNHSPSLVCRGYNTLVILFGQLPMKFRRNKMWETYA
jgi:hypothetical protein